MKGMPEIIVQDSLYEEELQTAADATFIPWSEMRNCTILVTGCTGLIGSSVMRTLIRANEKHNLNCKIIAWVRDLDRAKEKFGNEKLNCVRFYVGDIISFPEISDSIDFIIHGASQTQSIEFVERAVETIQTSVYGTNNILELAKQKSVKSVVYLSSMEVYGYPQKGHKVSEEEAGTLSPNEIRNSYPISKQLCESLCCAYLKEYNVPVKIARLTQTFGAGVRYDDARVFAYFARCVIEKKNIVLTTKGETERSYLYITDAVTAILTIMLNGENGEAYNCADEDTYCSIKEMAEIVATEGGIEVEFKPQTELSNMYTKTLFMDLDTEKIKRLGWRVLIGGGSMAIKNMYRRMIVDMEKNLW